MGSTFANDLAQLETENGLMVHFRNNHFPPLPYSLVPVAMEAIKAYNEGNQPEFVKLPEGISWKGKDEAPFWECVQAWHLGPWLIDD